MLRWADKANVGSYLLYVAFDKEMTNPVYDRDNDGFFQPIQLVQPAWTPTAALPDSQAGTAYYYKVVPCSYTKCEALTHAQHSFDKLSRQVVLNPAQQTVIGATAPANCPTDPTTNPPNLQVCQNDVTLSWQDFRKTEKDNAGDNTPLESPGRTEARSYVVQTSIDSSFNSQIETIEVDQTTLTSYITTYPEGPVYWRVRAVDASINSLAWSQTGVFIKRSPVPVLESPDLHQVVRGDLFFQWQSLPFAAQYRIEVYRNHDTDANAVNQAVIPATVRSRAVSVPDLLAQLPPMPNGDDPYVWRIRRIDAAEPHGRLEQLGRVPGGRALGDPDLARRRRPRRALRRPVQLAGRPRRRELPLRAAGGRHDRQRRADHDPGDVLGAAARHRRWQLGVAGHADRRLRQQPDALDVAALHGGGHRVRHHGRGHRWQRPRRHPPHRDDPAGVELRRCGHHDVPVAPQRQPDRRRAWPELHGRPAPTSARTSRSGPLERVPATCPARSTSNTIAGSQGDAPIAVTDVSISGTGKVGTNLTLTPPVWDNDFTTTTYQWQRDGVNVGATTTTYTVVAADVGKALTVKATGTRTGYDPGSSTSLPVTGILGDAPNATTGVTISGANNKVGTTLDVDRADLVDDGRGHHLPVVPRRDRDHRSDRQPRTSSRSRTSARRSRSARPGPRRATRRARRPATPSSAPRSTR